MNIYVVSKSVTLIGEIFSSYELAEKFYNSLENHEQNELNIYTHHVWDIDRNKL